MPPITARFAPRIVLAVGSAVSRYFELRGALAVGSAVSRYFELRGALAVASAVSSYFEPRGLLVLVALACLPGLALAQTDNGNGSGTGTDNGSGTDNGTAADSGTSGGKDGANAQTSLQPFDACGVLVRGTECVLFEGGGGKYYVPDTGGHRVGDAIRVVGTLDPNCATFCQEGDGCISGAKVYDPAVYPCGTDIPSFPGDIVTNACTTISAGTMTLAVVGMWLTRRTGREKVKK